MLTRIESSKVPSDLTTSLIFHDVNVVMSDGGIKITTKADTRSAYRPLTLPIQLFECVEGQIRVAVLIYCSPEEFLGARITADVLELYFKILDEDRYYILREKISQLRILAAEGAITIRFADYY